MAENDHKREMRDALRLEPFTLGGVSQLVKVLALEHGTPSAVSGYVTQERFLLGSLPMDIERAMGMRVGSLRSGCRVFKLKRQPGPSECVYELTTQYPDGLSYTTMSDQRFPPSDKHFIHQWRLTTEIPAVMLAELGPGDRYSLH